MKAARLENSARLRRVADLLADGREYSTLDIIMGAGVCAVNSCVAELRDKSLGQRADALIAIAAPQFRDGLADDWRALRSSFAG